MPSYSKCQTRSGRSRLHILLKRAVRSLRPLFFYKAQMRLFLKSWTTKLFDAQVAKLARLRSALKNSPRVLKYQLRFYEEFSLFQAIVLEWGSRAQVR